MDDWLRVIPYRLAVVTILDDDRFYHGCSSSGAGIFLLPRRISFLYEQANPFITHGNVQAHAHGSLLNISNATTGQRKGLEIKELWLALLAAARDGFRKAF